MRIICNGCGGDFSKRWSNVDFEKAERGSFCSRECYLKQFGAEASGVMKQCSRCGHEKDSSLFMKRYSGSRKGQFSPQCKQCFSNEQMARFHAVKLEIIHRLGGKCCKCDRPFHPAVFELHHRDPSSKSYSWADLRTKSKEIREAEIVKCDLICPSCHRLEHINQDIWDLAEKFYLKNGSQHSGSN